MVAVYNKKNKLLFTTTNYKHMKNRLLHLLGKSIITIPVDNCLPQRDSPTPGPSTRQTKL